MQSTLFTFPTLEDGFYRIEQQYCNMIERYRDHDLSPEEQDWMDWANNALIEV
jgi:hypothetical protein